MDDLKTLDMSLSFPRKGFNKLLKEKQEQIKENFDFVDSMRNSVVDIHEYDEQDAITRSILDNFDKR